MERYPLLYGIIPESEMNIQISFYSIPAVLSALHVTDTQLRSFESVLSESLESVKNQPSVAIQDVFKALGDQRLLLRVTGRDNEYGSADSVRLIKTALYLFGRGILR